MAFRGSGTDTEGLVTVTPDLLTEMSTWSDLEIGDVVYLWKAFSSNSKTLTRGTGTRLENLFWRIWSSSTLMSGLDGKDLGRLVLGIVQDESFRKENTTTVEDRPQTESREKKPAGKSVLKKPTQPDPRAHASLPQTTRLLLMSAAGEKKMRKPSHPPTPVSGAQGGGVSGGMRRGWKRGLVRVGRGYGDGNGSANGNANGNGSKMGVRRKTSCTGIGPGAAPTTPTASPNRNRHHHRSPPASDLTSPSEIWVDLADDDPDFNDPPPNEIPASFIQTLRSHIKAYPPVHPSNRDPSLDLDPWSNPDATETDLWYGWHRQPTKNKLVADGFRGRFVKDVEMARAVWEKEEEEARVLREVARRRLARRRRRVEEDVVEIRPEPDAQTEEDADLDADASPPVFSESMTETETEADDTDTPASTFHDDMDAAVLDTSIRVDFALTGGGAQMRSAPVRAPPRRRVSRAAMASSWSNRGRVRTRLDAVAEEREEGDYPVW